MQTYKDILEYTKNLVPIETTYSDGRIEVFAYNNQIDIVHDPLNKEFYFTKVQDRHISDPVDRTWHREDGPAIIFIDGHKEWFLNDKKYTFDEWLGLTPISEQEKLKLRLQYAECSSS